MEGVGDSPNNIPAFPTDDGHRMPIHQGGQDTRIASRGESVHVIDNNESSLENDDHCWKRLKRGVRSSHITKVVGVTTELQEISPKSVVNAQSSLNLPPETNSMGILPTNMDFEVFH